MKAYFEKLKAYVETHPIQFDDECDFPALDCLYWHYSECHNMSNEKTKQANADLNACLDDLSLKDNDRVFFLVGVLCTEHERITFLAGLQLGAQLILELQKQNGSCSAVNAQPPVPCFASQVVRQ